MQCKKWKNIIRKSILLLSESWWMWAVYAGLDDNKLITNKDGKKVKKLYEFENVLGQREH